MASTIHPQISDTAETPDDCAMCLEPMTAKEPVTAAYTCRHIFHEDCIQSWDTYSLLCPCCRARKTAIRDDRLPWDDSRLAALRLEWMYAATYQDNDNLDPAAFCARLEAGRNNFIAKWGRTSDRR